MIVSESRKFVFVHIFKTAGTSVKRALRRYAMPGWQEPVNFFFKRMGIPQFGPRQWSDHFSAGQLIEEIGRQQFNSYFSFAFVRNPWDWEVSHYKYICRNDRHVDHERVRKFVGFSDYLKWRCDGNFRLQRDYLTDGDDLVVDFVGRFERLDVDFAHVCSQIGVKRRLPKLNRTRRRPFREFYDANLVELITKTYEPDIRLFEYEFDSGNGET